MHLAAYNLAYLAKVAASDRAVERATRVFGSAEASFTAMAAHLDPYSAEEYEPAQAAARAQLGDAA